MFNNSLSNILKHLFLLDKAITDESRKAKDNNVATEFHCTVYLLITAQDMRVYDVDSGDCGPGGQTTGIKAAWIYWYLDLGKSFSYTSSFPICEMEGKKVTMSRAIANNI